MAGIFRNNPKTPEGKYLVKRRDGTVPEWPWFVLGASDPAVPSTLRHYADVSEQLGKDPQYIQDLRNLADTFEEWRKANGEGDPDAPAHRKDDPETIEQMKKGKGS